MNFFVKYADAPRAPAVLLAEDYDATEHADHGSWLLFEPQAAA